MEKTNVFLFDQGNNSSISLNVSKEIAALCETDPAYARSLLWITKKQMGIEIHPEKFILTLQDGVNCAEYPITVDPHEYCKAFHDMCFATELLSKAKNNASSSVMSREPVASTSGGVSRDEEVLFRSKVNDEEEDNFVDEIVAVNVAESSCQNDSSENECDSDGNEPKKRKTDGGWSDRETRYLLSLYKTHKDTLQFNQRKMWRIISAELQKKGSAKTFSQCKSKIDNLKTKYKITSDHNKRTGNDPKTCKFYEELDEIFSSKAWVSPQYVAGPMSPMNFKENKSCKKNQVGEKFLELQNKKLEDNRQYRADKLNLLREVSSNIFKKK